MLNWQPASAADTGSLQPIAQREIQRRQGLVNEAEAQLEEGKLLLEKDKPDEAGRVFLKAYESLPKSQLTEPLRAQLRSAYATAECMWARQLLNEGRYQEAFEALDTVLAENMDPGNKQALSLRKQGSDPDRYPPALTAQHIINTKEVTRLLTMAGSATDLGDYDKARDFYQQALRVDAYNVAARRGLERLEQFKSGFADAARDHTRAKLMTQVNAQWEHQVPPSDMLAAQLAGSNGGGNVTHGGREKIEGQLRDLRVPHVEFTNAALDEVVEYLRVSSRNVDPTGRGIDFIMNLDAEARGRQLTLNLNDVPFEELVRYITEMAGATFRVENHGVMIVSLTDKSTNLVTKSYRVPPDFIQTAAVDSAAAAPADPFAAAPKGGGSTLQVHRMGAKEFLEGRGITFPEGASATFSGSTSTLIVRNTTENLNLVDLLVEQAMASGAKQAVISVRMIEISQTRLDEMGFDWELGKFSLPGSNRVFGSGGGVGNQGSAEAFQAGMPGGGDVNSTLMTGGLRSSGAILGNPSVDGLIAANKGANVPKIDSRSPSQLALLGVFTDPQFQVALRSLSQSKGVDLVTAPTITTKSGQKASVRVVREFPYPTEFDPPQIPQSVGGTITARISLTGVNVAPTNTSGPITPTTPTAFEKREVGTILEVEPVISADGRTVEISLNPSDVEFEGFVDYGSPISNAMDNFAFNATLGTYVNTNGARYVQENHIYQPIFRKTHVNTAVNVYDGSTVVLGGLVSNTRTDITDKVPLIGDLPLIGRFWQSKVTQDEKKCVLFFVTVKVIDPSGQRVNLPAASGAQ